MDSTSLTAVFFAFLLGSGSAFAEAGSVTINSPADGAMLNAKDKIMLNYAAVPGPEGDHLHLNIDGKRVDVIRQLKGSTEVAALDPGNHQICLAVNTKAHVPTGVEKCINITTK
ncbi:MAG TPA: hypothetical protein VFW53_02175 [Gallionella sp.]|nr:hypothetical protein [Gallionella sp.]